VQTHRNENTESSTAFVQHPNPSHLKNNNESKVRDPNQNIKEMGEKETEHQKKLVTYGNLNPET